MKHLFILGFSLITLATNQLSVLAIPKSAINQEYIQNNKSKQNSGLPVVGVIKHEDIQNLSRSGCFGSFQLVKDDEKNHKNYLFMVTDTMRKSPAVMNLDGKYIIMKPITEKWGKQDTLINQTFSYKNVKIRADYSVYNSSEHFGKLEGTMYNIKLTLTRGSNKKVLQLRGYSGC